MTDSSLLGIALFALGHVYTAVTKESEGEISQVSKQRSCLVPEDDTSSIMKCLLKRSATNYCAFVTEQFHIFIPLQTECSMPFLSFRLRACTFLEICPRMSMHIDHTFRSTDVHEPIYIDRVVKAQP